MIGLMNDTQIRHAAVRAPDGRLHDVRGYISEEELGRPFGLPYPYTLKVVTEKDLTREGESQEAREETITRARKMAETLWQELPWKDSYASRVLAFAAELEALSRKHKLWIRSQTPASFPMIALGEDDEAGYRLRPTFVGHFGIDRYFEHEINQ